MGNAERQYKHWLVLLVCHCRGAVLAMHSMLEHVQLMTDVLNRLDQQTENQSARLAAVLLLVEFAAVSSTASAKVYIYTM